MSNLSTLYLSDIVCNCYIKYHFLFEIAIRSNVFVGGTTRKMEIV